MTIVFVCVGFASCGSDDDDKSNNGGVPNELVGIWAQYHKGGATAWYYGIKLDANGDGKVDTETTIKYDRNNHEKCIVVQKDHKFLNI